MTCSTITLISEPECPILFYIYAHRFALKICYRYKSDAFILIHIKVNLLLVNIKFHILMKISFIASFKDWFQPYSMINLHLYS